MQRLKFPSFLLAFILVVWSGSILAAVPNISPAMIEQLKRLPLEQQRALAAQYGIELPGTLLSSEAGLEADVVGAPGEVIVPFEDRYLGGLSEFDRSMALYDLMQDLDKDSGELERFGARIFDREISTFAPVDDMPAPELYALGPGDELDILLYGKEQRQLSLKISRDGALNFPQLGPLAMTGLTFAEGKRLIEERVRTQFVGTNVIVSLAKLRSINVFLAGEVQAPGSYSVSGLSTIMQVLYAAGGVTDIGSMRKIQVMRRGEVVSTFDLYDVLMRGDTSKDVRLSSGDTVFVPLVEASMSVDGQVNRPAIYELQKGDSLGDVLAMAGGVSTGGFSKAVSLTRFVEATSSFIRIEANLQDNAKLKMSMMDGDALLVQEARREVVNEVTLRGAVARPGGYAWSEGKRISDLITDVDADLLPETDLSTGLIVRRVGGGLEVEPLALNVGLAVASPGSEHDLVLQARDEILIFTLPYLNDSYTQLLAAKGEGEDQNGVDSSSESPEEEGEQGYTGVLEWSQEQDGDEDSESDVKEDRSDLIGEVVFRLQAQAQTPATTMVISVTGDVRLPGAYPLLAGQGLTQHIALAGGFESSAFLERAEVSRIEFSDDGTARMRTIDIPLKSVLAGDNDFRLQPRDQLRISRIPNWSYGDTVTLSGAITFPGEYPISPGDTLSSVLRRAGGLEETAFADGAVLIKTSAKAREQEQLRKLVQSIQKKELSRVRTREDTGTSGVQTGSLLSDSEQLKALLEADVGGRVVIDLGEIIAGNADADLQLQGGDTLTVPEYSRTISVIGEVRQPGTFRHQEDLSLNDYLELAAGTTIRALEREIYLVRANGGVEQLSTRRSLLRFDPQGSREIRPGDTIVVPVNEDYQPALAKYREVTSVVFQSMASIFPLLRL